MVEKGEQSADQVTERSIQARRRFATISKTTPKETLEAVLVTGQNLIGEPPGEAGRSPEKLDKRGRPRGYNLQVVLGLGEYPGTYAHHRAVVKQMATRIDWNKTFKRQGSAQVEASIAAALKKLPIYHLYENHWPLREILKSHCKSGRDRDRQLHKRMDQEGTLEADSNAGSPPPNRVAPPQQNAPLGNPARPQNSAARTRAQRAAEEAAASITQYDGEPDPDEEEEEGGPDGEESEELPPPPKKRARGGQNPDRNLPGNRTPNAKQLGSSQKAQTKKAKKPNKVATASMRLRKELAYQKADELQRKRAQGT